MTNNSANQDYTNNADGFTLGGGTTERKLTVIGADVTITGGGTADITMPGSSTTLVGRDTTDTLTNKSIDASANTIAINLVTLTNATSQTTTSSTDVVLGGLTYQVTIPSGGRRVKLTLGCYYATVSGTSGVIAFYRGASSGALTTLVGSMLVGSAGIMNVAMAVDTPTAGTYYYSAAFHSNNTADAFSVNTATNSPIFFTIDLM